MQENSAVPYMNGPRSRWSCRRRAVALVFILAAVPAGPSGCNLFGGADQPEVPASERNTENGAGESGGPPTEAEVRATIERVLSEIYASDAASGAKSAGIAFTFGPVQVAPKIEKQVEWGQDAQEVYPVRVPVTVRASYQNYPGAPAWERTTERGVRSDDVFLFYRDAFGDWTFKTGRP